MKQKKKLLLTACVGGALSVIWLAVSLFSREPLTSLIRPENGEGDRKEKLEVWIGEEPYSIEVTVRERPKTEAETAEELQKAEDGMELLFLGENQDLEHITQKVNMPSVYPGTDIAIQWYLNSWEYISVDGTVKNEGFTRAEQVEVTAVLSLEDQTVSWDRTVWVCPLENQDNKALIRILSWKMEDTQKEDTETVELPEQAAGQSIMWYPEKDHTWLMLAGLTACAVCAMMLGQQKEEEKALAEREKRMKLAYPDIVSRLSLYMGAGISSRKAWERIAAGYRNRTPGPVNEAYEEMCTTLYEMQNGVPESIAYEKFGARCRLPSYLKLGALLSQNLRKGTRNLSGLLEEESREAFENRKAYAKKLGEECESRLLFPMLLMLLTILVMVMYPAVTSFQT